MEKWRQVRALLDAPPVRGFGGQAPGALAAGSRTLPAAPGPLVSPDQEAAAFAAFSGMAGGG